jgi:hypothetical protein
MGKITGKKPFSAFSLRMAISAELGRVPVVCIPIPCPHEIGNTSMHKMTGGAWSRFLGLLVEDILFFRRRFSQIVGRPRNQGLFLVTLSAKGVITPVLNQEKLFIFRIVGLVTGSAYQLSFGAEKDLFAISPLLRNLSSLSRKNIEGVGKVGSFRIN